MTSKTSMPDDGLEILLVDDDPNMLLIAEWALRLDPAMSVRPFSSATAALAALREGERRPDMLVVDMAMPDMDGMALIGRLADLPADRRVPVIFLTGRHLPDDVASMRGAGAIGIIAKPFEPETLARLVRETLGAALRRRAESP